MNKSPDAFRTISEVADQLDVPAHVLRFWETRFNQVKPVKRGGGRRYYRPDDVRLLRGIRGLLYDNGMTIKGVQKILREQGVRHVIGLGTVDGTEAPGFVPPVRTPGVPALGEAGAHSPAVPAEAGARSPVVPAEAGARSPVVPAEAEAEAVLTIAGGAAAARPVGAGAHGGDGRDGRGADLFDIAAAGRDPAQAEAGGVAPPIGAKVHREALRRLLGELEALRRVMAGSELG